MPAVLVPLLNITEISTKELGKFALQEVDKSFNFSVRNDAIFWYASGSRGVLRTISSAKYSLLPKFNISSIDTDRIPEESDLLGFAYGHYEIVRRETPENDSNDPCGEAMTRALKAASWRAGEQDKISTGLSDSDFLDRPPPLLRNIELSFVIAATILALCTAGKLLYIRAKMKQTLYNSLYVLLVAMGYYVIEALVLYNTYKVALDSFTSSGLFAHLDGSMSAYKASDGADWDAKGSIFILVSVVGSAQFRKTSHALMAFIMVVATLIFLASIGLYLLNQWKAFKAARANQDFDFSPASSSRWKMLFLVSDGETNNNNANSSNPAMSSKNHTNTSQLAEDV